MTDTATNTASRQRPTEERSQSQSVTNKTKPVKKLLGLYFISLPCCLYVVIWNHINQAQ